MRQGSPMSNGYSVDQVIPAKRLRHGDDENNSNLGMTASPRQPQFSGSRSQTPQQPTYPPYPVQHIRPQPSSNLYHPQQQHMQKTASNGMPHIATSQAQAQAQAQAWIQQNAAAQSRMNQSPRAQNHQYPPDLRIAQGNMQPGMAHRPGNGGPQSQTNPMPDAVREAQQRYRQQLEMQQRQFGANNFGGRSNMAQAPPVGPPNGSPHNQTNLIQQASSRGHQEAAFSSSLSDFLAKKGLVAEPNPSVAGQPVSYFKLFYLINSLQILTPGSPHFNNWAFAVEQLNIPVAQFSSAVEELKGLFGRNLASFAQEWKQLVNKRRMKAAQVQMQQQQQQHLQQQHQQQQQVQKAQQPPPNVAGPVGFRTMSPVTSSTGVPQSVHQVASAGQMFSLDMNQQTLGVSMHGTPSTRQMSIPHSASPFGTQTPSQDTGLMRRDTSRPPRSGEGRQSLGHELSLSDQQVQAKKEEPMVQQPPKVDRPAAIIASRLDDGQASGKSAMYMPRKYVDGVDAEATFGGLPIDAIVLREAELGLAKIRPGVPTFEDLGFIELHALTMSIQSGIHAEVRYALDHLIGLTHDTRVGFGLGECENLLEALVDCGEEQLDALIAAHGPALDDIAFPNFENLTRRASWEAKFSVDEKPTFASPDYQLEHAAERLIAITAILRNLSIPDSLQNHDMLTRETCASFIASAAREVGLRPTLLRSTANLVDFMKDVVTLLSNVAHRLKIPSRDDAESLLRFLLAFSPRGSPSVSGKNSRLVFCPYEPRRNQYLPSAIDALAKLFARDEPNRSFLRSIFATQPQSTPATNLLTQAFALAIAPIPNRQAPNVLAEQDDLKSIALERNPFFTQGMLAADILASLLQGSDDRLAREWLASEDGWAHSLLHMLMILGFDRSNTVHVRHHGRATEEPEGCDLIAQRGLSMLKRLVEKADRGDDTAADDLLGLTPDPLVVLTALTSGGFETGALRHLVAFAALGS